MPAASSPKCFDVGRPSDGKKHGLHDRFCALRRAGVFDEELVSVEVVWSSPTVLVCVSMPWRWKARSSSTEMLGSACGTIAGLASNRLTRVPKIGQDGGDLTSGIGCADDSHGRGQRRQPS